MKEREKERETRQATRQTGGRPRSRQVIRTRTKAPSRHKAEAFMKTTAIAFRNPPCKRAKGATMLRPMRDGLIVNNALRAQKQNWTQANSRHSTLCTNAPLPMHFCIGKKRQRKWPPERPQYLHWHLGALRGAVGF